MPVSDWPMRPKHPDMQRLIEIITSLDRASDGTHNIIPDLLQEIGVDEDSAAYMSMQRALRVSILGDASQLGLSALWLDGFILGAVYARTSAFPQTEAEAITCPHGNKVWFGHECGECETT